MLHVAERLLRPLPVPESVPKRVGTVPPELKAEVVAVAVTASGVIVQVPATEVYPTELVWVVGWVNDPEIVGAVEAFVTTFGPIVAEVTVSPVGVVAPNVETVVYPELSEVPLYTEDPVFPVAVTEGRSATSIGACIVEIVPALLYETPPAPDMSQGPVLFVLNPVPVQLEAKEPRLPIVVAEPKEPELSAYTTPETV